MHDPLDYCTCGIHHNGTMVKEYPSATQLSSAREMVWRHVDITPPYAVVVVAPGM